MSVRLNLEALWDFSDPAGAEERFAALLQQLAAPSQISERAEVLSQIARAQGFQRRHDEAYATLARAARPNLSARAQVRLLLEEGRLDHSTGRDGLGAPQFRAALERAEAHGEEALAIDATHMLGIVTEPAEQIVWNDRAIAMAERARDPRARRWLGILYMNQARSHRLAGDLQGAARLFRFAESWIAAQDRPEQHRTARWNLAHCLRLLGEIDEAFAIQQALAAEYAALGRDDPYVREELGELLLLKSEPEAAQHMFAAAVASFAAQPWRIGAAELAVLTEKAGGRK